MKMSIQGGNLFHHLVRDPLFFLLLLAIGVIAVFFFYSSKLKRAKTALKAEEEKYRSFVEKFQGIAFRITFASEPIILDGAVQEITGYPREAFLSGEITWDQLVYPEDLSSIQHARDRAALDEGCGLHHEYRIRHREGRTVWIHEQVQTIRGESKGPDLQGILLDISDRIWMEQALISGEARFRAVFESSGLGIAQISPEGRFLCLNQALGTMLEYSPSELENASMRELTHPEDWPRESELLERLLEGSEEVDRLEGRFLRKNGECVWGRLTGTAVRGENGMPIFLVMVVEDITEERKEQEERERLANRFLQNQKMESLGVLSGGIAHDFNNLLMGVLGNASMALMELPSYSPARESIEQIEVAAQRAADLTRQLLAYSGKGRFQISPLDVSDLIRQMHSLLQVTISRDAVLRMNLEEDLPCIEADAAQIRQVILNLVTNASEALDEKSGVVSIRTGQMECDPAYLEESFLDENPTPGLYIFIEVSDTGCGMERETMDRIFDPFFTTRFVGRGLGLPAVLGIVRGHRGTLKVYSEPGRGSSFKVLFPAMAPVVHPSFVSRVEDGGWHGSGLILVADDEEAVRNVAGRILEMAGFEVLTARDGIEAVDSYEREQSRIVLVLLDMTMPRMGGEETFQKLRQIRKDVRVLLSSGYNEQEAMECFAGKGIAGFIQKPYRRDQLIQKVRLVLGSGWENSAIS